MPKYFLNNSHTNLWIFFLQDCENGFFLQGDEAQEKKEIHDILFPVIEHYFYPEQPTSEFNILPKESPSVSIVSKVCPGSIFLSVQFTFI